MRKILFRTLLLAIACGTVSPLPAVANGGGGNGHYGSPGR